MKNNSYVCDINMEFLISDNLALINTNIHTVQGYGSTIIIVSEEGDTVFIETVIEANKVNNYI